MAPTAIAAIGSAPILRRRPMFAGEEQVDRPPARARRTPVIEDRPVGAEKVRDHDA
jgi:hypothetical protein